MINTIFHKKCLQRYIDELASVCMHDNLIFRHLYKKKEAAPIVLQWNIRDTDSLTHRLDWLLNVGYQSEYERTRQFLSTFTSQNRRSYVLSLSDEDIRYSRLSVTERTWGRLPKNRIAAFDYAWCIVLATAGHTLDILNEYSLEGYVNQAALKAQSDYSSWEEYLFAYSVGAEFSGRFHKAHFARKNEAHFLQLLHAWQQRINRVNWNTPVK
ncbi:DUF1266 domain-containing protein [Gorillibacterium sp. sgz5001074]|uniref:DUF1266 domain-containing protein n=1 Tax=Gorillibacterium sp. sgz5001074 TaxID=3446695 RepID=UPI003F668A2F